MDMMNIPSPQNEVTEALYYVAKEVHDNVHIDITPMSASYPFIEISEQFNRDSLNKDSFNGIINQTINIYGKAEQRMEVMQIEAKLLYNIRKLTKTKNFHLMIRAGSGMTLIEQYEEGNLFRRVLEVVIRFY